MPWHFIAPMRCRMVSLEVRDAQQVEQGQVLAVFEDCRGLLMQTVIKSPCSGTFRSFDIEEGQEVEAGTKVFGVE